MAFTTTMTTTTSLDTHLIKIYDNEFFISGENTYTKGIPSLATAKRAGEAQDWNFTIYSKLTVQTSALDHDDDVTSEEMSDAERTITPIELGNTVTPTRLAVVQSGGMHALGAVRVAAVNMGESLEKAAILVLEASANELYVGQADEASLTAANVLTAAYVKQAKNKLVRVGIPGPHIAIAHDDVLYDLRNSTSSNEWTDVSKYADPASILENEIGMFGGFRWINSPLVTINADAGASAVDTYHTMFIGYNALGYAESQAPGGVISGPFDKLKRFVNIGWYGIFAFGIVDTNACWLVTSASSIGSNT